MTPLMANSHHRALRSKFCASDEPHPQSDTTYLLFGSRVLLNVAPATLDQHGHTWVDHAVENEWALRTTVHQPRVSQALELVGDGLNRHADFFGQVAYMHIPLTDQCVNEPEPRRMGKHLENAS